MIDDMTIEDYFKEVDDNSLIWVKEGCKTCQKITIRIPHLLLVDMLKNCEQSGLRDLLIQKLKDGDISDQLRNTLKVNHIWDKIGGVV